MRHKFEISIGDWSGDGHGKQKTFQATANNDIEAVREAYFKAAKKHPKLRPDLTENHMTRRYEERDIPEEQFLLMQAAGAPIPENREWIEREFMAEFTVWFINEGDPELKVKLIQSKPLPTLAFYGSDSKKRHINFIGYGLFE